MYSEVNKQKLHKLTKLILTKMKTKSSDQSNISQEKEKFS